MELYDYFNEGIEGGGEDGREEERDWIQRRRGRWMKPKRGGMRERDEKEERRREKA